MKTFILLLSDDIFTCISLEDEFAALGFQTFSVIHHEEAREILLERRGDIIGIVCDIDFAYMSQRSLFPAVPVVMLTSGDEVDPSPLAQTLRKPTTPLEIVSRLSHALLGEEGESLWEEGNKAYAAR